MHDTVAASPGEGSFRRHQVTRRSLSPSNNWLKSAKLINACPRITFLDVRDTSCSLVLLTASRKAGGHMIELVDS